MGHIRFVWLCRRFLSPCHRRERRSRRLRRRGRRLARRFYRGWRDWTRWCRVLDQSLLCRCPCFQRNGNAQRNFDAAWSSILMWRFRVRNLYGRCRWLCTRAICHSARVNCAAPRTHRRFGLGRWRCWGRCRGPNCGRHGICFARLVNRDLNRGLRRSSTCWGLSNRNSLRCRCRESSYLASKFQ